MTDCPFSQQLSAYHDGELDAHARAAFEGHLQQCSACAAQLAQLRALSGLFASAAQPRLSQISTHRLHRTVDAVMDEGIVRAARFTSAAAAAVLLVCSILLAQMGRATAAPPPWVELAAPADSASVDASTPAAVQYLADASGRSEDVP